MQECPATGPLDHQIEFLQRRMTKTWLWSAGPVSTVVGYADVRALLLDNRLDSDAAGFVELVGVKEGLLHDLLVLSPLNSDGEAHRRWRTVVASLFTPRAVGKVAASLELLSAQLIDWIRESGQCEFMASYAEPFALHGLCALIGVPDDDRPEFQQRASDVGRLLSSVPAELDELEQQLAPLLEYADDLLRRRKLEPSDDLVTRIAEEMLDNPAFSADTARITVAGLIFTGLETVKCQLGWSVAKLTERPDLWRAAGTGDIDLSALIEELLRYRSVNGALGRKVHEDFDYRGHRFRRGERVLLSLWAANNDPTQYPRCDEVAPEDNRGQHVAFGLGAHYCLGAALAREELKVALRTLTAELPCPVIAADTVWKPAIAPTGPERLVLQFGEAGA